MAFPELLSAFSAYYPRVLAILTSSLESEIPPSLLAHALAVVRHGTAGGKLSRGLVTCSTFCELTGISATDPRAEVGFLLGWALEVLQASYLIADDLMDSSEVRRGQKCWYLFPNVGKFAAVDALFLENCSFFLTAEVRKFLPDLTVDKINDTLRWSIVVTTMGQTFDTLGNTHAMECYNIVADYKTAHYTIWLPIVLAMVASEKVPQDAIDDAGFGQLLMDMGRYFQVEDDWLDVYGDPELMGKIGTDLQSGKVTWLSCRAMELCDDKQRAELVKSLGADETKAREIYAAVNVSGEYERYEKETRESLQKRVESLADVYPKASIQALLRSLTKRRA
jgi:farnesyl diphosphate synthase